MKDCDDGKLMPLLQQLLPDACEADSSLWLSYLKRKREEKIKEDQELWLTDIVSAHDDITKFKDAVDKSNGTSYLLETVQLNKLIYSIFEVVM